MCDISRMGKNKNKRLNIVYSTSTELEYEYDGEEQEESIPNAKQNLKIALEKKGRGGKTASIIRDFIGPEEELKALGKELKSALGTGGSIKDGEIIIQGERRKDIKAYLDKMGYPSKFSGG